MEKFTLVPRAFFDASDPAKLLSQLVHLEKDDTIEYIELPEYGAVLVYCNSVPAVYRLSGSLACIPESDKVVMQYNGAALSLVVARDGKLLLANCFEAADFTTALYFLMAALDQTDIVPEETVVRYSGELEYAWQEVLFKYFKGIERVA